MSSASKPFLPPGLAAARWRIQHGRCYTCGQMVELKDATIVQAEPLLDYSFENACLIHRRRTGRPSCEPEPITAPRSRR